MSKNILRHQGAFALKSRYVASHCRTVVAGVAISVALSPEQSPRGCRLHRSLRRLNCPKLHPSQVSSSEGLPPLPYPAVALKRQEKKNLPTPLGSITKIRTSDPEDWARTPNDVKGLLEWMSTQMKVSFSSNVKPFRAISTDPIQNPILYRSGYKPFERSQQEISILREYVLRGGTIIFNSLVGNPDFYKSALRATAGVFPRVPSIVCEWIIPCSIPSTTSARSLTVTG